MIRAPFIKEQFKGGIATTSSRRLATKYTKKLRTKVTIPPLVIPNNIWRGASEIVRLYKLSYAERLSFRNIIRPTNANFVVCVSYIDSPGVVTRYKLWEGVGEIAYYPLYKGENLGNNFILEVWNTPAATLSNDGLSFYLSKMVIPTCLCDDEDIDITQNLNLRECSDLSFDLTDFVPALGDYYHISDGDDGCSLATLVKGEIKDSIILQSVDDETWHKFKLIVVDDYDILGQTYIDYTIDPTNEEPQEKPYLPLKFGDNIYGIKLKTEIDPESGETYYAPFVEQVDDTVAQSMQILRNVDDLQLYSIEVSEIESGTYTILIGQEVIDL